VAKGRKVLKRGHLIKISEAEKFAVKRRAVRGVKDTWERVNSTFKRERRDRSLT